MIFDDDNPRFVLVKNKDLSRDNIEEEVEDREIGRFNNIFTLFGFTIEIVGGEVRAYDKHSRPLEMHFELNDTYSIPLEDVIENKYNSNIDVFLTNKNIFLAKRDYISFKFRTYNNQLVISHLAYYPSNNQLGDVNGLKFEINHSERFPYVDVSYSYMSDKEHFRKVAIYEYGHITASVFSEDDYGRLVENKNLSYDECLSVLNGLPFLDNIVDYLAVSYPRVRELLDLGRQEGKSDHCYE